MQRFTRFIFSLMVAAGLIACQGGDAPNFENPQSLGFKKSGIVGGETAWDQADPGYWSVGLLQMKVIEKQGEEILSQFHSTCTGTLIETDLVLTAAHCVLPEKPQEGTRVVVEGSVAFPQGEQKFQILEVRAHPAYQDGRTMSDSGATLTNPRHDVALVRLSAQTESPLIVANLRVSEFTEGQALQTRAYGFGATAYENNFFSTQVKSESELPLRQVDLEGQVQNRQLHYLQTEKGVCRGDSGGPHFLYLENGPELVAVSSHLNEVSAADPDWCRKKSIAVLVSESLSWIILTAGEMR